MLMQGYGFILQFDYGRILLYNKVIPAMTMGTTQLLQIHVLSRRGQQHTTGVSILLAYYVQDCKCNPNVNSFFNLVSICVIWRAYEHVMPNFGHDTSELSRKLRKQLFEITSLRSKHKLV